MKIIVKYDNTCDVVTKENGEVEITPIFASEKSPASVLHLTVVNDNGVELDAVRLQVSGANGKFLRRAGEAIKPLADTITKQE